MFNVKEVIQTIRNDPVVNPLIGTGFVALYTSLENIEAKLGRIDSIIRTVRKDIHLHHPNLAISPSKPKVSEANEHQHSKNQTTKIEDNLYFTYFWAVTLSDQILNIPDINRDVNIKLKFSNECNDYKNVLKTFMNLTHDERIHYTHKSLNLVINLITTLAKQYVDISWNQRISELTAARELIEKELAVHRLELDNVSSEVQELRHQLSESHTLPSATATSVESTKKDHFLSKKDDIFWNNLKQLRDTALCAMEDLNNIYLTGISVAYASPYYHIHNNADEPNYIDMLFHDVIHVNISSILIDAISYGRRIDTNPYPIFKMSDGDRIFEIQWHTTTTLTVVANGSVVRELTFPEIEKGIYILDVRLSYKRNNNNEKYDEMVSLHNHQFTVDRQARKCAKISSEVLKIKHSGSELYEIVDVGYSYVYDTYNILSLFGLDNVVVNEGVENLLLFHSLSKCIDGPITQVDKMFSMHNTYNSELNDINTGVSNIVQIMRNNNLMQHNNAHRAKANLELRLIAGANTPTLSYVLGRRNYIGKAVFVSTLGSRGFIGTSSTTTNDLSVKFDFNHNDTYTSNLSDAGYRVDFKNINGIINLDYQSKVFGELNATISLTNDSRLGWYYRTGTKYSDIIAKSEFNVSVTPNPLASLTYGFKHETEHILVSSYSIEDISVVYNNYILFGFPTLGPSKVHGDITLTVSHLTFGGSTYGQDTSPVNYTELTYKNIRWNAGKSSFNLQKIFKECKLISGWLAPLIKVTKRDIDKFKPRLEQPGSTYANSSLMFKYIYNEDEDALYGITREDYQNLSIKNPSKLILSPLGIWYAGDLLSITLSAGNVMVDYVYNPLNVVSYDTTNYDISDVIKRNSDVMLLMKSLQYDVSTVQNELYYIKSIISNINRPNLMSVFTNLMWLSGSLTPLVSIVMSGVMLAESIIDSVTHEHLTYERAVESVLYFIHLLVAIRDVKGLSITNLHVSPIVIKALSQHIRNLRNNITRINEKTFPNLNGYSKLIEVSPTSLNMTVNCHWRKLSADSGVTRKYYDLIEKYSNGTITPLERIHLKSLEKMRIVPLHEYISVRTHAEKDDKEHIMFTVYGVSDGNALPTNGALFGRNNTRTLLSIPADTAGIWKAKFSRKKEENDEWTICSWRDSSMSKNDILLAAGHDTNKDIPSIKVQEMYESISYNLLNFNKSVVSRSENIMISEKQLQALDTLILESRHGYQYRLIGNNCQVLSNDIINLMKDPRNKPHWVTEKQYTDYVSALYESFT